MLEPLTNALLQARQVSRAQFEAAHPEPAVVVEPFEAPSEGGFHTIRLSAPPAGALGLQLGWLRKRPGANAFDSMVTIGRAKNNDLVVDAPAVSKFHAYVQAESEGGLVLMDAGSTYGTTVNDKPLAARTGRVLLKARDVIGLGGVVRMTYFTSGELYDLLSARAAS